MKHVITSDTDPVRIVISIPMDKVKDPRYNRLHGKIVSAVEEFERESRATAIIERDIGHEE